jgi:MFS family permease
MASKLILRFGKYVLQIGSIILAVAFFLQMNYLTPGVDGWTIILLMSIWGLGNGLVLPSLLNLTLKNVPMEYAGAAAGVYSTFQQTASALGVSIIGGIFFYFSSQGWQIAYTAGLIALIICTALVIIMLSLLPESNPKTVSGIKESLPVNLAE